jgi:hypothetical protein
MYQTEVFMKKEVERRIKISKSNNALS